MKRPRKLKITMTEMQVTSDIIKSMREQLDFLKRKIWHKSTEQHKQLKASRDALDGFYYGGAKI